MVGRRVAFAVAMVAAMAASGPVAAADRDCVVFCVGIERYDQAGMDQLEYVGEDAFAVWNRLKAIARVDESRSRLLVADREKKGPLPNDPRQARERIDRKEIVPALDDFLRGVRDGDLVIIYLGGHGVIGRDPTRVGVTFCTSDYKKEDSPARGLLMNAMFLQLQQVRDDRPGAEFVVLGNMCHAGAAMPHQGAESVKPEDVKKAAGVDQREIGGRRVAYIPACSGSLSTFEDPKLRASLYAYHLLRALEGGGVRGTARTLTTGSVLEELQRSLSPPPPELAGFDRGIAIGTLLEREAALRRLVGMGLLSEAMDRDDAAGRRMLELAGRQFGLCAQLTETARLENLFSRLQCLRALGQDVEGVLREIADAAGEIAEPRTEIERVAVEVRKRLGTPRPKAEGFYVVVYGRVGSKTRAPGPPAEMFLSEISRKQATGWLDALSGSPGYRDGSILPIKIDDISGRAVAPGSFEPDELRAKVREFAERVKGEPSIPYLVLVYAGFGVYSDSHGRMAYPFTAEAFWDVVRLWPGKAVVVWSAGQGIRLGDIPDDLVKKGTSLLMLEWVRPARKLQVEAAIKEARAGFREDTLSDLRKRFDLGFGDMSPLENRPEWVGDFKPPAFWGESAKYTALFAIGGAGRPSAWWPARFATAPPGEWLGLPPTADPARGERPVGKMSEWRLRLQRSEAADASDPFATLQVGALREALKEHAVAAGKYREFAELLRAKLEGTPPALDPDLDGLRARARARLKGFAALVERTAKERLGNSDGKVRLVTAAVDDYKSPLIGDLAGCHEDVEAWVKALRGRYGQEGVIHYPAEPATAASMKAALEKAAGACAGRPQDVLVFVFSGRGLQTRQQRYLVGQDAEPSWGPEGFVFPDNEMSVARLAMLLEQVKGSSVVFLDCQFAHPAPPLASPLQKNLFATMPHLREYLLLDVLEEFLSGWRQKNDAADRGQSDRVPRSRTRWPVTPPVTTVEDRSALPKMGEAPPPTFYIVELPRTAGSQAPLVEAIRNQTYVWWVGPLEQEMNGVTPRSLFTRSLLKALGESSEDTYGGWLTRAGAVEETAGRFAIQGPVVRPILTSGPDDQVLPFLLSDHYRRREGLDLAIDACEAGETLLTRPIDRLCRAELRRARAELLGDEQGRAPRDRAAADREQSRRSVYLAAEDAGGLVQDGLVDAAANLAAELLPPDQGRDLVLGLLARGGARSLTPVLQRRLVDLSKAAMTQDANARVRETITTVNKLDLPAARRETVADQLRDLLKDEEGPAELRPVLPFP